MKTYELVCAFRIKEGQDVAGIEAVKKILTDHSVEIKSEEDMGDRELAYEIDRETRGRYRLFNVELNQEKLPKIEDELKLRPEILRYLFVVCG
ncbi:MAG: 30S ribosomal protein S6 [Spirochaetales bacterium]|nr:MAG: 30S ribosomal protein S6 [Spirochaetales bacterium]